MGVQSIELENLILPRQAAAKDQIVSHNSAFEICNDGLNTITAVNRRDFEAPTAGPCRNMQSESQSQPPITRRSHIFITLVPSPNDPL